MATFTAVRNKKQTAGAMLGVRSFSADDLLRRRQVNDKICAAHGLSVLEQLEKRSKKKRMKPGEY